MSDTDDAPHAVPAAPRDPARPLLPAAVGAAEGAAIAAGTFAACSPMVPAAALESPLTWAGALAGGALVGAFAAHRRAARAASAGALLTPAAPPAARRDAWLQVVSGSARPAVEATLVELLAARLARGERVLVVDAARRLALHEAFGGDPRLGLVECLAGRFPLLGLVQGGGRPGLYLLAHGASAGEARWSQLGRLFEEAWPHFTRLYLVVEPSSPRELGDALRGRLLEGWWAGDARSLSQVALALAERLGISFLRSDLEVLPEPLPEALARRVAAIRETLPGPLAEPPALERRPAEPPAAEPVRRREVLDCDLQVQERLRFLIWMRRVQAEGRREVLVPALRG
jgi:hypothetical protein